MTTSVLAADAEQDNLFKCGMAVAPVTNWIYYDTIYTERYMGLPSPDDNLEGYRKSDVTTKAKKLKGKKLLLVHGTAGKKHVHSLLSRQLSNVLCRRQRPLPADDDVDAGVGGGKRAVPAAELPGRESRDCTAQAALLPLAHKLHPQHLFRKK